MVAERLLSDEADVGFVEGLTVPTGLDSVVIAHDRLIVVTAPAHPLGPSAAFPGCGGAGVDAADPA
ncbi:hypothetical protein SVIOM74S_06247 [Streptomyces violarus]